MEFPTILVTAQGGVTEASTSRFNYDATEGKGRRKVPNPTAQSEDAILVPAKRDKLVANSRDLARNYAIMCWMMRCHLNYVTQFNFHAQTEDEDFNTQLEAIIDKESSADLCDVRGRHSLASFTRLAELRCLIDGDIGIMRLDSLHLQAIEGDRIRDPDKNGTEGWTQGIKLDKKTGRPAQYAIHKRTKSGFEFERAVPAENMYLLGYWDRFDQTRGITPISAALNSLRDVYENIEQALLKAKVHNQFGLKIKRAASGDDVEEETDEETGRTSYKVDFGSGPFMLDLDPEDDAEFMMSNHPPHELPDFTCSKKHDELSVLQTVGSLPSKISTFLHQSISI